MNHGVEGYQETFRPHCSVDQLLLDPCVYRGNESYEKYHGPGITEDHIVDFIKYWGVDQYKEWCARDVTYDSIISNGRFALAQQIYLEKQLSTVTTSYIGAVYPSYNPFEREFRDHKGNPVPEPPLEPLLDDFCDQSYSIYIQNNGIINYMLKINSINTLEHLLNYWDVAEWQRRYIKKLEYEDKLI
jgi:hypothetical protein